VTADTPEPAGYWAQVTQEIVRFDERRRFIADQVADGKLSVRQGANEWVRTVREHLAARELLREASTHAAAESRRLG
jgi:hypothetical protein